MNRQEVNPVLKIDPEFESRIPPLTEEEFKQLEENIIAEGSVQMPLIIWNGTILDGHNRYKIARAHPEIIYTVYEKDFANRYEALAWICKNQLGRRNLTALQKEILIGERYNAEKQAEFYCGNQYTLPKQSGVGQIDPPQNRHGTRTRIAEETGVSEASVRRYAQFSNGVSAAEELSPGFRQEILSGNIKPTQKEMRAIARGSLDEKKSIIDQIFCRGKKAPNMVRDKKINCFPDVTLNTSADADEHFVTMESAAKQFEWEVTKVMQDFDITFDQWPQLISDEKYRKQVVATLQDLKQYILHIEGGTRYEWDRESRKIAL